MTEHARQTSGRKDFLFYSLNIVIPLVLGTVIYLIFRPDTYISQLLYKVLGITRDPSGISAAMPKWLLLPIRNFSCDILWAYALTFAINLFWRRDAKISLFAFGICVLFEFVMELSQKTGIMSGTFDWLDIGLEICTTAFATLLIKHQKENKNE